MQFLKLVHFLFLGVLTTLLFSKSIKFTLIETSIFSTCHKIPYKFVD